MADVNHIYDARKALAAANKHAANVRANAAKADELNTKAMKKAQKDLDMARSYGCSPTVLNAAEHVAGQTGIEACNAATKWRAEIEAADKAVRDAKAVLRNLLKQQQEHNAAFAAQAQMYEDQIAALKQEHWAVKSALERTMAAQELHYKSLLKEREEAAKAVSEAAKAAEDAAESKKLKDAEAAKAAELAAEIESLLQ